MYSFFGKGYYVAPSEPPPEGTLPPSDDITIPSDEVEVGDDERPAVAKATITAASSPARETEVQRRLRILRTQLAAKRRAEEKRILSVQERHRKQAAYGRDVRQIRPKTAGYGTESEKIMGGGTGYHARPPLSGLGDAAQEVDQASLELQEATELVKQLAKDVKTGTALKSELEKAILDLRRKAARAKSVVKQLSGYGEAKGKWNPLLALAAVGLVVWLLRTKS